MLLPSSPSKSLAAENDFRSRSRRPCLESLRPWRTARKSTEENLAFHVGVFFSLQKVVYQCTYPGCKIAAVKSIRSIEAHVRREHLGRADDHPDDGEEEFYYTEVEIPSTAPRMRSYTEPASQMANLSLADHLDMARPAHEDPGFPLSSSTLLAASGFRNKIRSFSGNQGNKSSLLINQYHQGGAISGGPASLTTPITIAPSIVSVRGWLAKIYANICIVANDNMISLF